MATVTRMAGLWRELIRVNLLRRLEERLALCGFSAVAGVDEAGRGGLAGPVVAAAVIPNPHCFVPSVDDSKQLDAATRERLATDIRATAIAFAVASVDAATIDSINILEATKVAMRSAIESLRPAPDCVITDAVYLRGLAVPCLPVVRGDAISYAVASASILAKVERDRTMRDLDRVYPQYGFAVHKGYGAPEHLSALERFGPSPVHRLTFHSVVPRGMRPAI